MKTKILIVEDDAHTREMIGYILEKEGYEAVSASSGEQGLEIMKAFLPDLVLLDLILPGMTGYELCEKMKSRPGLKDVLVIMLTEKREVKDITRGLTTYADDYIPKPFHPRILAARIDAVLRRRGKTAAEKPGRIELPGLVIDPERREVFADGERVDLKKMEFDILFFLASNKNKIFPRDRIISAARGDDYFVYDRVVDNHIYKIRKKLKEKGSMIETVSGMGYRLNG
ncbi:MAG: response regulator transcription factor [Planctomycetes bacterium]|nr:response regulator transcription factor [Planctomycetota bacterium]